MKIELIHLLLLFQCNFLTFIFRISWVLKPCTVHLHRGELYTLCMFLLWLLYNVSSLIRVFLLKDWLLHSQRTGSSSTVPEWLGPAVLSSSGIWECLLGASSLHRDEAQLCTVPQQCSPSTWRGNLGSWPSGCCGRHQRILLLHTKILWSYKKCFYHSI